MASNESGRPRHVTDNSTDSIQGIHKTDPLSNWKGPRKITLKRNASGYGFTLRHFIVYPPESAVAELTRQEGATEDDGDRKKKRTKIAALEPMDTIFVKHVKKNGPAESAGLSTGDRIVSVNGESVTGKTYSQVVALIQASGSSLRLLVVPREEDILQVAYPTSAYKFSPEKKPLDPTSSGVHSNITRTRSESFELPSSSSSSQVSSSSPVGSLQLDDSNDTVIVGTGVERGDADFQRSSTEMILSVGTKPIKTSTPVYTSRIPRRSSDDGSDEPPKVKIIMGEPNTSPRNSATYRPIPTSPTRNSVPSSPRSITPNKDNRVVLPTAYRATYAGNNTNSNAQKPHRTFKITSIFGSNNNSVRQTQNDPNIARSEASIYTSNATSGNHVNTSDSVTSSAVVNVPSRTPVLHIRSPLENNNQYNTQIARRQSDGMTSSQIPLPKHSTSLDNIQVQERPPGSNIVIQTPNGKHASSHDNLHVTPGNMVRLQIATPSDRKLSLQGSADSQLNTSTSSETTVRRYYRSETTEQRERSTSATDRLSAVTSASKIEMQGHSTNETRRFARHTSYDGSQRVFVQGYYQPSGISSSTGSVRHDATRHSRSATVSSVSSSSSQPESDRSLSDVSGAHTTNLHVKRSAMRTEQQEYISPSGERKVLSHSQEANEMRGMELVGNKGNMAVYRSGADVRSSQVTDSRGRVSSSGSVKQMQDGRVHDIMQMPSGEVRIIPKGPQGSIEYWDKKPITESGEQPKGIDESDSWLWQKRNSGQFVDVRNPQLSKSRIRERSLERDKRRERQMHERHRSRSYDRSHQRTQGWVRQQVNVRQHHQEGDNISLDRSQRGRSLSSSRERERSDSVASEDSFDDFEPVATRQRLVRRTSYLRATASEENGTSRDKKSTENEAPSITASKENVDEAGNKSTPPKRSTSIRKLKNFFGEGTPRIVEASTQDTANVPTSSHVTTLLPHESDVVKEGPANVKVELKDGKRAYDRSWKPVWISLRGHIMYFKKERREQGVVHPTTAYSSVEEHPLSIKAAMVDIAYDYTKKRNVFRLCTFSGSEYLIQVSDTQTMLAWISAIQTNNNPDDDVEGVVTQELILKSIYKRTHNDPPPSGGSKNNPVSPGTGRKKFMRGTSPAVPKKSSVKDDSIKGKSKAFAGMMKTSMKWKGGVPQPNEEITPTHAFCVPLETCVPSSNNEFVPMLVDICCDIVHEKGLTVVGIYRIPGNTAGVTYLQEELNKGVEQVNLEDERWNEVNVVGSLLKLFFRKLPNPLVPKDQYSLFIRANRCDDPAERMWALRRQIHDLPDHHYETFKHLANHLKDVASNSDINKMEVRNLAIVFGPTLIRAADDSMVTMVTDMSDQCRIVESIIQHCDWFFNDDVESQQDVPSDAMPESDVMPDANCLLATAKEDDKSGESGSDSAKNKDIAIDIVSSVLSAANRKLKGRSVKRAPLTLEDVDSDNFGFGERGTDSNSKVRALRLQNQDVEKPVVKEDEDDDVVLPSVTITLRRDSQSSIPSTITESEVGTAYSSDLESLATVQTFGSVKQQQTRHTRSHYRQGNTRDRKFSDSSITSDTSSQFSLPYGTSQLLESQTQRGSRKGIFISDGDWKSEFARERERIEREHAIAVQDYETEDHTNIEELYKSKDYLKAISSVSTKIADFASQEDNESKDAPELRPLPDSTSITSDYSTTSSSNNNNTLQEARSNASSSSPRQLSSREQSELMNSPTPLEELENESDFVQSMKATFDERLEKVLRQESEDDLSFDTHLQNNLERKLDEMKSNSRRTSPQKKCEPLRELEQSMENSELRTPSKDATPFDLSLITASLKSPSLDTKSFGGSPDNMSPMRSPRKVSRIEVILTLEKRDKTPASTPEVENIDPMTVEGSKVLKKRNKTPSKDTLSLKQKHRENRRRRHTVAGSGKGIPEYNQLMEYYFGSVNPDESSVKKSAFDRLKPFGKEVKGPELRDMTSWLKSERVRNSNSFPNLASSSVSSLNESNAKAERPSSIPLFDDKRSLHVQKSPPPKEPRPQVLSREPRYYEIESYI